MSSVLLGETLDYVSCFPHTFRGSIRFLRASITTEHRAQSRLLYLVIKKQLVIYYLFLLEKKTEGSCNYLE